MYINTNYVIFFGFILDITNVIGKITYLYNNFESVKDICKSQRLEIKLEDLE